MRALLDANVLIALFDPKHIFHERSHSWFSDEGKAGWASCPLTENALVRIMSNPNYDRNHRFSASQIVGQLTDFVHATDHQFWQDDISLRDRDLFSTDHIHGPRQLTDIYLLALAARNQGRLVTFDTAIPVSAASAAKPVNLCVV